MLVNSVHKYIQQKNIRESNCYFQDTILKQFWYCVIDFTCTHHNLGTQIKNLYKLVLVTKGNLFLSYKNEWWGRHMLLSQEFSRFYLKFSQ